MIQSDLKILVIKQKLFIGMLWNIRMLKVRPVVSDPGIVMLAGILAMAIVASLIHGPSVTGEAKARYGVSVDSGCVDTDGGKVFGVFGVVTDRRGRTGSDVCLKPARLKEFYCGSSGDRASQGVNCPSGQFCQDGACVAPVASVSCTDGLKNQDESDVDCGGLKCSKCVVGRFCGVSGDCVSGLCSGGVCVQPVVCGNGQCEAGESCSSCSQDCGVCPSVCGDGSCNGNESCSSCALDCGSCLAVCGNSKCESGESCSSCSQDCGVCTSRCGDGSCNGNETCSSCSTDCGSCPIVCGNGKCESGETCSSCAQDCGICTTFFCQDNDATTPSDFYVKSSCADAEGTHDDYCETATLVRDWYCSGTWDGTKWLNQYCAPGGYACPYGCKDGACLTQQPVGSYCGDGRCNGNENCSTCSSDCGTCSSSSYCQDNEVSKRKTQPSPPYTKGTCVDAQGSHVDYCDADGVAKDWYCTGGTWNGTKMIDGYCTTGGYVCSYGCQDGACILPVCGNGNCETGESCSTCPADCAAVNCGGEYCGDGYCYTDHWEYCTNCPEDCTADCYKVVCGDGACAGNETCSTCPGDCGACS